MPFPIQVYNLLGLFLRRCTYFAGVFGAAERKTLSCAVPVIGRYVYISLRVQEWLTLCEVEVYSPDPGTMGKNEFKQLFMVVLEKR